MYLIDHRFPYNLTHSYIVPTYSCTCKIHNVQCTSEQYNWNIICTNSILTPHINKISSILLELIHSLFSIRINTYIEIVYICSCYHSIWVWSGSYELLPAWFGTRIIKLGHLLARASLCDYKFIMCKALDSAHYDAEWLILLWWPVI